MELENKNAPFGDFEIVDVDLEYGDGGGAAKSAGGEPVTSDRALVESVNACGAVDIRHMSDISGIPVEQLISDLRGTIYQDPEALRGDEEWSAEKGWVLAPRYLGGSIPRKLKAARDAEARFPGRFGDNVEALEKRVPPKVDIEDVHVSLGALWVPPFIYVDFVCSLLGLGERPAVYFNKKLSEWHVDPTPGVKNQLRRSYANRITYGTTKMSALEIIEQTMNARSVKVYDTIPCGNRRTERVLNAEKTLEAQEKQRAIIEFFDEWIMNDPSRKRTLQEEYNKQFTGYVFTPYDGSFLTLPGLAPDVTLYPHQRSAIARVLLSDDNVLLAHDVGSGKTFEMIVAAHELKRMRLSEKTLIVVPNNVIEATVAAHRKLYPFDDILAIIPGDQFSRQRRESVLEEIRDGDHVCIYMAYSSFDLIVMSKNHWIKKKKGEIADLNRAASNASRQGEKRALEAEARRKAKALDLFEAETKDTPWLPFEALRINTLIVDEAHNYKNVPINSRTDGIVGMHSKGSAKCVQMLEKCRSVERVIFATGTPLTNSLADLFVIQTYLQPEELRFREIDNFDMWINTFGERETNYEIGVDTNSLRPVTRFSNFHNLFELMSLFSTVCDFHAVRPEEDELPSFGGYKDICVPRSPAQTKYIKLISERTEAIHLRQVSRKDDNLLKVTNDGRLCALEIRLLDLQDTDIVLTPEDIRNNKLNACADNVRETYEKYPGTCQIVFSDVGTPKDGFNVYDELKSLLTERGVPAVEIAFVHDATTTKERAALFAMMNSGALRVVIGSTQKLGVGVNVQEKLIALHHLSVPWRPADMVQREGRILRRGNTCREVFIYHYVTEGSFDSYSWQLLENKQRFISGFLSGTSGVRDQADISGTVLTYAEVKALAIGDPLIKKRVETSNALERARISMRRRERQLADLQSVIDRAPERIRKAEDFRRKAESDAAYYAETRDATVPLEERRAFGEELAAALADNRYRREERVFGGYQCFDVILPANMPPDKPFVFVTREDGGKYRVEIDPEKPLGCAMRIDKLLEEFEKRAEGFQSQIDEIKEQRANAIADVERGNEYELQADALAAELEEIDRQLQNSEEGDKSA